MAWKEAGNALERLGGLSEYGMHIVVPKDPTAPESIDIVAVHGLNGHWETTWTDEDTGYNWLKDCIPEYTPTARVMSFSYDSSVQLSKAVADVSDFGDQLLAGLSSRRLSETEQNRPIVFICHSLGGIVFKQAFIRVFEESSQYDYFRETIKGVLFFATPHRGSSMASVAGPFGRVLKACSFNTSTNTQLLKDLELRSRVLDNISRSFLGISSKLDISSFYELDKISFMSTLVVERDSAVLGLPNEIVVPLNGTHRTICRFAKNEPRLAVVVYQLRNVVNFWLRRVQNSPPRLLIELGKSAHKLHKERNPAAVPGTCSWVLDHPEYQRWYEEPGSALMWLSANPGCGKSVMVSYLIDKYENLVKRDDVQLCYWFFKSDSHEQASAVIAVRGLLRQVLGFRHYAIKAVSEYLQGKDLNDLKVLWTSFIIAVDSVPTETVPFNHPDGSARYKENTTLCLIDGLDECEMTSRKTLMLLIASYFASSHASGTLKMLFASRPDNWIKVAIDNLQLSASQRSKTEGPQKRCCTIRLKGENESDNISADVELVIKSSIGELIQQGLPETLLQGVQGQLIVRADRTFLWATLILQLLREKVEAGASRRQIDKIIDSRTIDSIFTELLNSRPDAPRTRKLFSVILAATRPLNVQELSIALALDPENDCLSNSSRPFRPGPRTCDDVEYELVYPFENHVRSVGGHFIRIIHDRVYFVHETAREFLLKEEEGAATIRSASSSDDDAIALWQYEDLDALPPPIATSAWYHSISLSSCHALLLDICVTYLYLIGKLGIKSPLDFTGDLSKFLDYSSKSWPKHFQRLSNRIQPWNVPYYHNLCHTAFPGFNIWTSQFWGGGHHPLFGLSAEEQQDHYIQYFGVEVEEKTRNRVRPSPEPFELEEPPTYQPRSARHSFVSFSSNPTSKSDHNFPTRADENGFVSVDFSRSFKK